MANTSLIQVRASEDDKKRAAEILEQLGTNISSVVNMLLKQIILTGSVPFEVRLPENTPYTQHQMMDEVVATMAMEGLALNEDDLQMLKRYSQGKATGDELRTEIIREFGEDCE